MRGKVLLGAATAAALFGLVTEANAVPQFQLRIVSGTYDHTFVSIDNTAVAGTVSAALNNINGGGGNKFMSGPTGTTLIQGTYDYTPTLTGTDFYFALSVPDIYHNSKTAGTISFYLTLYDMALPPSGVPLPFTYDLAGTNAGTHVPSGPDNASQGHFYYSATDSHDPVGNPGVALVTTPAISSNFAPPPTECTTSGSDKKSYSCEYIDGVSLTPLYSLTQEITLNYSSASVVGLKARAQSGVDIEYAVPEPATLAILGTGLLAAGTRFGRRKKAAKQDA